VVIQSADEVGQEHEAAAEDADHHQVIDPAVISHLGDHLVYTLLDLFGRDQDIVGVVRTHAEILADWAATKRHKKHKDFFVHLVLLCG
jgi:hypothetical protein